MKNFGRKRNRYIALHGIASVSFRLTVWHSICVAENIDLPDFKIPHAEKIEWMIETNGWALEPVAAVPDSDPPMPGYAYTIGLNESFSFPDIVIFGLAPVAVKGLIDLVIEQVTSGVEIPRDVPLVGLLDNELRCVFSTVDVIANAHLFTTGVKWNRGKVGDMLQLVWPDRNGWLPFESGFDASMRLAQPAIGIAPTL
jgi:hypothetical protein